MLGEMCMAVSRGICPTDHEVPSGCCSSMGAKWDGILSVNKTGYVCCNTPCHDMEKLGCEVPPRCHERSHKGLDYGQLGFKSGLLDNYLNGPYPTEIGQVVPGLIAPPPLYGGYGDEYKGDFPGQGLHDYDDSEDKHVEEITVDDLMNSLIEALSADDDVYSYDKVMTSDPLFKKDEFGGVVDSFNYIDPNYFLDAIYGTPKTYGGGFRQGHSAYSGYGGGYQDSAYGAVNGNLGYGGNKYGHSPYAVSSYDPSVYGAGGYGSSVHGAADYASSVYGGVPRYDAGYGASGYVSKRYSNHYGNLNHGVGFGPSSQFPTGYGASGYSNGYGGQSYNSGYGDGYGGVSYNSGYGTSGTSYGSGQGSSSYATSGASYGSGHGSSNYGASGTSYGSGHGSSNYGASGTSYGSGHGSSNYGASGTSYGSGHGSSNYGTTYDSGYKTSKYGDSGYGSPYVTSTPVDNYGASGYGTNYGNTGYNVGYGASNQGHGYGSNHYSPNSEYAQVDNAYGSQYTNNGISQAGYAVQSSYNHNSGYESQSDSDGSYASPSDGYQQADWGSGSESGYESPTSGYPAASSIYSSGNAYGVHQSEDSYTAGGWNPNTNKNYHYGGVGGSYSQPHLPNFNIPLHFGEIHTDAWRSGQKVTKEKDSDSAKSETSETT
nr:glycine-rich cell wall structural protein 1.8-like [Lepeophtheirus salmonis]